MKLRSYYRYFLLKRFLVYFATFILIAFFILPIVWVLLTSFKTRAQIIQMPPLFIFSPTLSQYRQLFQETSFAQNLLNSLIVSTSAALISLAIGTLGAYGLARFDFRGKPNVAFWVLSTRMAPPFGFLVPFYLLMRDLHLLDTRFSLIVIYQVFNLAFVIWMMRGFFSEIPVEIEESALIDGCSPLGVFYRVSLPLVLPGLVATFIFCFIMSWNEFLFAFTMVRQTRQTVPVGIAAYVGLMGIRWGQMASAGMIATLPILIFSFIVQKHLVRGLTLGAVKR